MTDSGKYKGGHDNMLLTDAVCGVIGASRPLKVFPQGTIVDIWALGKTFAHRAVCGVIGASNLTFAINCFVCLA